MKLKDYTTIKDNTERVHTFLDDNAKWMEDYISDCPDFINDYADVLFESELYFDEVDDDDKTLIKYLIDNDNVDTVYDHCTVEYTKGYHLISNELASCGLGEQEVQFSGLSDNDCDCIYTEITKDIDKDELKKILDSSAQCVFSDCLYLDYSYDRASLILNVDELIDNLTE